MYAPCTCTLQRHNYMRNHPGKRCCSSEHIQAYSCTGSVICTLYGQSHSDSVELLCSTSSAVVVALQINTSSKVGSGRASSSMNRARTVLRTLSELKKSILILNITNHIVSRFPGNTEVMHLASESAAIIIICYTSDFTCCLQFLGKVSTCWSSVLRLYYPLPGGVTMRLGWPHFRIVLNVLWIGTAAAKMYACRRLFSLLYNDNRHTITYIEVLG